MEALLEQTENEILRGSVSIEVAVRWTEGEGRRAWNECESLELLAGLLATARPPAAAEGLLACANRLGESVAPRRAKIRESILTLRNAPGVLGCCALARSIAGWILDAAAEGPEARAAAEHAMVHVFRTHAPIPEPAQLVDAAERHAKWF